MHLATFIKIPLDPYSKKQKLYISDIEKTSISAIDFLLTKNFYMP
jgi:hypothetical protein